MTFLIVAVLSAGVLVGALALLRRWYVYYFLMNWIRNANCD